MSLIRGVQLGLALVLLLKGGQYILGDPYLRLAAGIATFLLSKLFRPDGWASPMA